MRTEPILLELGLDLGKIKQFQDEVLNWYRVHARDLPWRHTQDPYAVIVSETMLQQTQVTRVIPRYLAWLERLPTFEDLAAASRAEVLALWSGLGYNRRAVRLHELAGVVLERHSGVLPTELGSLLALPGVGRYTAAAILAFAHNRDVGLVDTNVRRVLLHRLELPPDLPQSTLEALAGAIVPPGHSRDWYNALMDLGATVLTATETGVRARSRQSAFSGSSRWVRGQLVRRLVAGEILSVAELQAEYQRADLPLLLDALQTEGLLDRDGEYLHLPGRVRP